MAQEQLQRAEVGLAQQVAAAVVGLQQVGARVQDPPGETQPCHLRRGGRGRLHGRLPPQYRTQPQQQLARVERLGHVVIGAHFQAEDAVGRAATRGQHDHRQGGLLAQLLAQRQPILAGQHQVQHHRVEGPGSQCRAHAITVAGDDGLQALLAQVLGEQGADLRIVIDDQDAGGRGLGFGHGRIFPDAAPACRAAGRCHGDA